MFGFDILDVAIGMVFIFLSLSLLCSGLQEVLAKILNLRSENLKEGIDNLLSDPNVQDLSAKLYAHPLIKKLGRRDAAPSYIPAREFSLALVDVLKTGAAPEDGDSPFKAVAGSISNLPDGELKTALSALVDDAEGSIGDVRKNLEDWFDDSMDRVSGWYKRSAQKVLMILALILTVGLNVDSIEVAKKLWQDPALRDVIVAEAKKADGEIEVTLENTRKRLADTGISIGWRDQFGDPWKDAGFWGKVGLALLTVLGWIITAFAVSLGAPFWFDGLGKLMSLRGSGKRPQSATT